MRRRRQPTAAQTVRDPASGQTFEQPGLQPTPLTVYLTLLFSLFMHGGIAHIAGNMPISGFSETTSRTRSGTGGTSASTGVWFLFQVVAGMGLLGDGSQAGGVAYAAHVGGFAAGLILVKVFAAGRGVPRPQRG